MSAHGPISNERLKSYADRIDRLEEEKKAITGDVRDIYTEVKSAGYNPKALRKVLAERRKKTDEELEADMEAYRSALGMPGATYRSVAEKLGVSKSKLHRLVPREKNGTLHDPETGEITNEIHRGAMQPKGCAKVVRTEPSMSGSVVASGDAVRDASAMPLDVVAAPHSEGREHTGSAATAPPACSTTEVTPGPQDLDLTPPSFLDQRKQVTA